MKKLYAILLIMAMLLGASATMAEMSPGIPEELVGEWQGKMFLGGLSDFVHIELDADGNGSISIEGKGDEGHAFSAAVSGSALEIKFAEDDPDGIRRGEGTFSFKDDVLNVKISVYTDDSQHNYDIYLAKLGGEEDAPKSTVDVSYKGKTFQLYYDGAEIIDGKLNVFVNGFGGLMIRNDKLVSIAWAKAVFGDETVKADDYYAKSGTLHAYTFPRDEMPDAIYLVPEEDKNNPVLLWQAEE